MTPGRASERLRIAIALADRGLEPATRAFWERPDLAALFPAFLLTLHCSVRATLPLMRAAEERCVALADADPLARQLAPYYRRHHNEELDHEQWLLDDMSSIGIESEQVAAFIPPGAVASMVGAQYYWISHYHPVALLGFFAVLEGNPPNLEHLAEIQQKTGLPDTAFRMLREHAELDQGHADELFELLDSLPLMTRHETLVRLSSLQTINALRSMFDGLLAQRDPPEGA